MKPICNRTPACAAAAMARSVSARVRAIGFSQKMCLPAAAVATIRSACVSVAVQISTATMLSSARAAR